MTAFEIRRPGRLALVPVVLVTLTMWACNSATPPAPTPPTTTTTVLPPPPPPPPPPPEPQTARYRVTFDALWSAATHPDDFPDDAHFSGLIGGTHDMSVAFWRAGELASLGIQRMAEEGSKTPLDTDVMAAVTAGTAEFLLSGGGLSDSPDSVSMEFTISQTFPLVTLVAMIAPSPDWFVGVSGVPLFDMGAWRSEVRVDLPPWDAGTDSGITFLAPDEDTRPHIPISQITGFPFLYQGQVRPIGTFTFVRLE